MSENRKIVDDILNYIGNDSKSSWYVGIATNVRNRLFVDHNVSEQKGRWIYRQADTEKTARDTENYLLENYPFKGNTGGGDYPKYVYAYKITSTTCQ